ncbi:MAG: flavodoxin family protein [Verrucomicrobiae bacterium]|nr:flavodoxin family protein [Verrucomicrobiae bacterium]
MQEFLGPTLAGICCSPRKGRATFEAMTVCLESARQAEPSINTVLIELAGRQIGHCIACDTCRKGLNCGLTDDFSDLISMLSAPSMIGIIIGTPVYVGNMTAQCKAFLDRSVVFRRNGWLWRDKIGGVLAVGAVRNGGQELAIQSVRAAMLCHDMICISEGGGTSHFGAALVSDQAGSVRNDDQGLALARNLGSRAARLAVQLKRGFATAG